MLKGVILSMLQPFSGLQLRYDYGQAGKLRIARRVHKDQLVLRNYISYYRRRDQRSCTIKTEKKYGAFSTFSGRHDMSIRDIFGYLHSEYGEDATPLFLCRLVPGNADLFPSLHSKFACISGAILWEFYETVRKC